MQTLFSLISSDHKENTTQRFFSDIHQSRFTKYGIIKALNTQTHGWVSAQQLCERVVTMTMAMAMLSDGINNDDSDDDDDDDDSQQ